MELLLHIEKYEEQMYGYGLSYQDIEDIKKEVDIEGIDDASVQNIGPGADVMVILVSIITVVEVFLLGNKIEEGIEGWIKIGRRIKHLFKKDELVAVDSDGASLLAIEFISGIESIQSLVKESEQEINLVRLEELFSDGRQPDDLISKPYSYFIQTYLVNEARYYIVGIKSTGEVNLIKCFDAWNGYGISEINFEK